MKLIVAAFTAWLLWFLSGVFLEKFWAKGLQVSLSFLQQAVVEGESACLKETITNNKLLPLPFLHVKFQMGRELLFLDSKNSNITDQNYRSDLFSCMPWQEIRRTLRFTCKKRGYYSIRQADLVSYDLFLFRHFVRSCPVDTAMYVYPGPVDLLRLNLPLKELLGQIVTKRALIRDPFEVQSIRPYQSFDSYKEINWKATARTGSLKVNVYAPAASWQVTFLLDVVSDTIWKDYPLIEEAVRLCGSMAKQLLEKGIPVSICTNGIDCLSNEPGFLKSGAGPEHLRSVMELLARIQIHKAAPDPDWFLHCQKVHSVDASIYVLISPQCQDPVAEAYNLFCSNSPDSQWILPKRANDCVQISCLSSNIHLFFWEVPYDYS